MPTAPGEADPRLPYGELAVALHASPMPDARFSAASVPTAQVDDWARAGIAALGGIARVGAIAQRSRELGRLRAKGLATPEEREEFALLWPSAARSNQACALAYYTICRRPRHDDRLPGSGSPLGAEFSTQEADRETQLSRMP